jgi:hypothetical protein
MRGRPTNNRRGPNPLTRSYESNGPDVKIRGNAHHVAEKYLQLARDAHTGGDPVAAENYLQHAEHYFRLIASAQAAQLQAQNGVGRPPGEVDEDEDDDDGGVLDRFASPAERAPTPFVPPPHIAPQPQYNPQPNLPNAAPFGYGERQPFDGDRQNQPDRNGFQPRQDRQNNRHQERGPRPDRPFQDRGDRQEGHRDNRGPNDGRPREFRPFREPNPPREPIPTIEPAATLPSFITAAPRIVPGPEAPETPAPAAPEVVAPPLAPSAPVVAPQPVVAESAAPADPSAPVVEPLGDVRFPAVRGRRRRARSPYGFPAEPNRDEGPQTPAGSDEVPVSE